MDFSTFVKVNGPTVKSNDFALHSVRGTVDLGFGMIVDAVDDQLN